MTPDLCPDCMHEVGEHLFHGCTHIEVRRDERFSNDKSRQGYQGYRQRNRPCLCPRTLGVHK